MKSRPRTPKRTTEQGGLAATERKLKGLIDALADGFRALGLRAQRDELLGWASAHHRYVNISAGCHEEPGDLPAIVFSVVLM